MNKTRYLTQAAVIAALYAVLTCRYPRPEYWLSAL